MSTILRAHPSRSGCSVCPSSEHTCPHHKSTYPRPSTAGRRSLGRRSLGTFTSMRGSKVRRALDASTSQEPDGAGATLRLPLTCATGSRPASHTKPKWYDSLRGRSSQAPISMSPRSVSSTVKRSRFFWSSPAQPTDADSPFDGHVPRTPLVLRAPLPKLEIESFQSELQRLSMFGEIADMSSLKDAGKNPRAQHLMPSVLLTGVPQT